jgi:hypothetical protein
VISEIAYAQRRVLSRDHIPDQPLIARSVFSYDYSRITDRGMPFDMSLDFRQFDPVPPYFDLIIFAP